MSTRHTPGSWRVLEREDDKPYIRIRGTALGHRYKIANVIEAIYDGNPAVERKETLANAVLIAAAPDLLAALRKAVLALAHICESDPKHAVMYGTDYLAVSDAIAKATNTSETP
jgi:hypothetical protein